MKARTIFVIVVPVGAIYSHRLIKRQVKGKNIYTFYGKKAAAGSSFYLQCFDQTQLRFLYSHVCNNCNLYKSGVTFYVDGKTVSRKTFSEYAYPPIHDHPPKPYTPPESATGNPLLDALIDHAQHSPLGHMMSQLLK